MAAGDIDVAAGLVEGRWGWPATAGGAGLREVDGRCLRGTPQVERGHEACWQIAAGMARHVGGRAQVARGGLAPLSSRESVLPATMAGPRGPVLPCRSRDRRGIFGGSVNDGRADRISKGGQYPAYVLRPGEYGHRLRQAGGSAACPAGSRRRWDGEMQLDSADLMGHDPNLRRADQAHCGTTDATRTERGIHAAGNGEIAGQWVFRWAGIGSL